MIIKIKSIEPEYRSIKTNKEFAILGYLIDYEIHSSDMLYGKFELITSSPVINIETIKSMIKQHIKEL